MAFAYTPGLKRKESYVIRKVRRLPLPGEVLVRKGEEVTSTTIVARYNAIGKAQIFNVAEGLDISRVYADAGSFAGSEGGGVLGDTGSIGSAGVKKHMLCKEGDKVEKGQIIAHYKAMFGLIKRNFRSPYTGLLETIDDVSGQVILRELQIPVNIDAHVPGTVAEVMEGEGAIIDTVGTYIQGIFGIGGEAQGEVRMLVNSSDDVLTPEMITPECTGKVVVGGSLVTGEVLSKAVKMGVKGIVVGGIEVKDLTNFLGYDVGVAVTGSENVGLSLIIMEGFGKMSMAKKTFELFKKYDGSLACIDGSTQIRAGVIRPEIIIVHPVDQSAAHNMEESEALITGMVPGLPVRIIRSPYFGALGHIRKLIVDLQKLDTESDARVLEVELLDSRVVTVPRANIELIEE